MWNWENALLINCLILPTFPRFLGGGVRGTERGLGRERGKLLSRLLCFFCLLLMHLSGEVKTFQRGDLGRHGMFFKIIPKFSYKRHKNHRHFTGCWKRYGTKARKAKAQSILPCNAAWPFKSRLEDFKVTY